MKSQDIRDRFSRYFENKKHQKIDSSPLIPQNDPTLLFANAGMNQFKDYFTGKENPKNRRAVTIQKCVRAGGKHNDLENVGMTARHHTFFEMLGNFSFGDYFKKEAIQFAWEFLTVELKMPPEKLYITVHHSDDEALEIWNKVIGVPLEKIFKKGDKDNFWEMGDTGPCGPCSEIFYDHGEKFSTPNFKPGKGQDILDDELRYVEIWNLVFMQFEKTKEGTTKLPKPSIDTGAGLERIAACLQGVYWNYDTDLFDLIKAAITKLTGKKYEDEKFCTSFRVVADHIRSSTMLITDGVIPSNEGRGYVLRRIIRRAVRHLKLLEAPNGSMSQLVDAVFETLGSEYPQNVANASLAKKLLDLEEKKFLETLDLGLKYLDDAIKDQVANKVFNGRAAFKLYDTYGFPLDLTEIILEEKGITVDNDEFEKAMEERKENSRKSWKGGEGIDNKLFYTSKEKHGATAFTGYDSLTTDAKLLDIIPVGELSALVFDQTPFYGESGGQAGDLGEILQDGKPLVQITDTQKPVDNFHVHIVENTTMLKTGETYTLAVDTQNRKLTARNHSATHLLQSALIEVLGDHIKQAGSSVDGQRLRFDFTHPQAVTQDEIERVEELVNQQIDNSLSVEASLMTKDQAMEKGALALFGEKYGDEVRVLVMGGFSTELCGGTHVLNTSEIGVFSIISESSLSTGVRRIEATTSANAIKRYSDRSRNLREIETLVNSKNAAAIQKVDQLLADLRDKQKEISALKNELQQINSESLFANPEAIGEFAFKIADAPEDSDLRKLSDNFIGKYENGILLLFGVKGDKQSVLLRAPKKSSVNCGSILKEALAMINGRGGGKPDMAQGSGDIGKKDEVAKFVKDRVTRSI